MYIYSKPLTTYHIFHLDGLYGFNFNEIKIGDCPADYLHYLVDNEVAIGICTPCAKNRGLDETKFFSNMLLDGGPHLIDMAIEAKVFNF